MMKIKFGLTNIFIQTLIFINSGFIMITQSNSIRQPTKFLILMICVLSFLSLLINFINYSREDKD